MNFDYQLYESGLSAHGCWEKFDEYDREALEKFAELIVRECIQVCNSRVGNSDYNTGRMHCVSDLKEHFGVE